jgi:hypothetical protein
VAALACLATLALMVLVVPSYAQVKPGDFITPRSAAKVKNLVSPGTYL